MPLLPQQIESPYYWSDVYKQPLSFWQQALHTIAELHHLPAEAWSRAALGRNVVFVGPSTVIKLGPPMWPGEMVREAAALDFLQGKLPVATPACIATGSLDGWDYLVETRLPGTMLRERWGQIDDTVRAQVAHQHGELMAAIHALPLDNASADLHFDWREMLDGQRECCASDMLAGGVDAALVAQVDRYLAATPWEIEQGHLALLHGDLANINFLVVESAGSMEITGIVDWGDVKIGAPSHEFISPGVHMYRDYRRAMHQWYQGYQLPTHLYGPDYQHVIMARAMLYYPDTFAKYIETIPGAASCTNWSAMASVFWQMDTPP